MRRPYYQFSTYDQTHFNWLTRVTDKDDSGYGVRFEFLGAFCPKCYAFDHDAVFERGFDEPVICIRVRKGRSILSTDDHFLCVSDGLLRELLAAGVCGFEHKPLRGRYWHVLRITNKRKFDPNVYRTDEQHEPPCPACRRVAQYGSVRFEREIDLPTDELTFFATDKERGQGGYDIFVTDKLMELLVQSGAKGGELHRLLTDEEEQRWRQIPSRWKRPKDALVSLGQHRETVND